MTETRPDKPLAAISLMIAATIFTPSMDIIAKWLTQSYPVAEVVWARYFFHLLLLAPWILWRLGPAGFVPGRPAFSCCAAPCC